MQSEVWDTYKPTDIEQVPELPGLYAWYLNFVNLQGFADPVKFLAKYTPYRRAFTHVAEDHQDESVSGRYVAKLTGAGAFGDRYSARLHVENSEINPDSQDHWEPGPNMNPEGSQQILKRLFNDSFPVFAAPIYIGKSDNLRRRVEEHLAAVRDAENVVDRFGSDWYNERDDMGNFARRLVALNLSSHSLLFVCAPIDPEKLGMSLEEVMHWVVETEVLYNNISRPLLGRK